MLFLGLNVDVHRAFIINFPFVFLMERKTERRKGREEGCTDYLKEKKKKRKPFKLKAHNFRQLLVRINTKHYNNSSSHL